MNELTKIASKSDYDIYLADEYINNNLPIPAICFPGSDGPLLFYQTRDSLLDIEVYKSFIDNCIRRFRKSRSYKAYKAYLMSLGMNRCQINGNIQDGMADIEMHHNFLTIYDITILISQHLLNTIGRCTTFDVVALLEQEHRLNNVPIVMLSETAHQLYHDTPDFYIPISMTFGKWWDLLVKYRYGITLDIAYKVINYIHLCQRNNELTDIQFYRFSNEIQQWGEYNSYGYFNNYCGYITDLDNSSNIGVTNYQYNPSYNNTFQVYGCSPQFNQGYSESQVFC